MCRISANLLLEVDLNHFSITGEPKPPWGVSIFVSLHMKLFWQNNNSVSRWSSTVVELPFWEAGLQVMFLPLLFLIFGVVSRQPPCKLTWTVHAHERNYLKRLLLVSVTLYGPGFGTCSPAVPYPWSCPTVPLWSSAVFLLSLPEPSHLGDSHIALLEVLTPYPD